MPLDKNINTPAAIIMDGMELKEIVKSGMWNVDGVVREFGVREFGSTCYPTVVRPLIRLVRRMRGRN